MDEEKKDAILDRWYDHLIKKYSEFNSGLVYKSAESSKLLLSDMFIQPYIVQDAVYGIGKSVSLEDKTVLDLAAKFEKCTPDDMLSNAQKNRHLIIGSLGTGKTSLLSYNIVKIAEYHLHGIQTTSRVVDTYKDKYMSCIFLKELIDETKKEFFSDLDLKKWIKKKLKGIFNEAYKELVDDMFDEYSKTGILLFIDGLDEISADERKALLKSISSFCANPDNVVIATIRKEVLVKESWIDEFSEFQHITLASFNPDQIKEYIFGWTQRYNRDTELRKLDGNEITKTILQDNYLKELAATPLFLTLMMLIAQENKGDLPRNRTRVYEEAVRLIIERWNKKYLELEDEAKSIRAALEQAAYNGMNNLVRQNEKSGDISAFIFDAFANTFPEKKVAGYLRSISEKTGIIIQTEESKYAFALQSFMEYFAACYISSQLDVAGFIKAQADNLIPWQEVIVFGVTKVALEHLEMAISVLFGLVQTDYNNKRKINPEIVLIAGIITKEVLSEASNNENIQLFKNRIKSWLKKYISDKSISFRLRFEIGNALERLGDDRKGVGIVNINGKNYPDIEWLLIPAGISEFGSSKGHINKVHSQFTGKYYISKYPITNAQFSLFLEDGYSSEEYWTKEGWAWLQGNKEISLENVNPDRYSEERKKEYEMWLDGRKHKKRTEPYWWQDYPWNISNRPVVGITWYEAVAYCNWLNTKCFKQFSKVLNAEDLRHAKVCLPTLEEWEKAARGPKCSMYPWGQSLDYKVIRANIDICSINETCAVGIFSEGKSGYKLYDVAGNVYEWIATGVKQKDPKSWERQEENLEQEFERLVKGGSWNMEYERAKAAYDEWDYPFIFDQNTGFRPIIRIESGNNEYRTSEV